MLLLSQFFLQSMQCIVCVQNVVYNRTDFDTQSAIEKQAAMYKWAQIFTSVHVHVRCMLILE